MIRGPCHGLLAAALIAILPLSCSSNGHDSRGAALERSLAAVRAEALRAHVEILASDAMEGRRPGSAGHDRARDYIARALEERGIQRAGDGGTSYFHVYPTAPQPEYLFPYPNGANVVGIHPGTTAPDELVVVSAHYDHLGSDRRGHVMNGAYDDAAGVAALIELASAFRSSGYGARRSVVFLFSDEEETPGDGALRWIRAPTVGDTRDIVFGISVDPIGRPNFPGYAWTALFGLEHSPTLDTLLRPRLAGFGKNDVIAGDRSVIPYFENDQDRFFDAGIPAVWFMTPGFSFYHQHTDDPETVDYAVLLDATAVLARVIDVVANDDQRYPFEAETPVTPATLLPYRTVFQRFAAADGVLSPLEIGIAKNVVTQLDHIEERGVVDPSAAKPLSLEATGLIFLTSVLHPGEVPVPFPSGATAASPR